MSVKSTSPLIFGNQSRLLIAKEFDCSPVMICLESDAMTGLWLYNTKNVALHPELVLAVLYSPSQLYNVCSIFVWEFFLSIFSALLGRIKYEQNADQCQWLPPPRPSSNVRALKELVKLLNQVYRPGGTAMYQPRPQGFSLPFFEGKALGTRLAMYGLYRYVLPLWRVWFSSSSTLG